MFWTPSSRRVLDELFTDINGIRGGVEFGSFMTSLAVARCGSLVAQRLNQGSLAPVGHVCCSLALIPLVACITVFRGLPN